MSIRERIEEIIEELKDLSEKLELISIRIEQLRQTINGLERYRFVNAVESLLDDIVYSFEGTKVEMERELSRIRGIVNDMMGRLYTIIGRLNNIEELARVVSTVAEAMKTIDASNVEKVLQFVVSCRKDQEQRLSR